MDNSKRLLEISGCTSRHLLVLSQRADDRRARIEKTGKTPEADRLPGALAAGAGAVAGHGARAHAESGHQRWRDAVQRGTALMAAFLGRVAQTQPLAAPRALGIQALNRSARQGMHRSLRCGAATRQKHSVNKRNSARMVLVSQEKYPLLVGVHFPEGFAAHFRHSPRREESVFALDFLAGLLVLGRRIIAFRGIFELAF
jgi:hypothetical protein